MIKGVIFDMDGLMFDTERIWATLWRPALATLGLSYKEGLDAAARGTAGDSMRAVLRRFFGPDCDTDAIMEALHQQAETAFQAPPPKKPGLDELIAYLEAQHIPTAAKALGTVPAETLVLEDSYNGVRAGARGGFVTVMVPDLAPADDEMRSLYTAECRDLFEVKKLLKAGKL